LVGSVAGEFVEPDKLPATLAMLFASVRTLGPLFIGVPACFCRVNITREQKMFSKPQKITSKDIAELVGTGRAVYFKIDGGRPLMDAENYMVQHELEAQVSHLVIAPAFARALQGAIKTREIEFIPTPLALGLYLVPQDIRDKTCAVICCEMFTTSVAVIAGDELCALETVDMGSAHVINDISLVKNIGYSAAKEIYERGTDAQDIIRARLDDIAEQIAAIIKTWGPGDLVKRPFYICGGHIDTIPAALEILGTALNAKITPLICPFTESNAPDKTSGDAVIISALKNS
jgi:hypothetical protein